MRRYTVLKVSLAGLYLAGCTTLETQTDAAAPPDLNPCLTQVMDFMEGEFDYTGTIARISGGYRTFITKSNHMRRDDGSWEYSSAGGDMEERSSSTVRLVGNQFLTRSGDEEDDAARTFTSCEGPNHVGRITTRSNYTLPPLPDETGELYIDVLAVYSESGAYFTETISDEAGTVVAYRSGVSVKTD